MRSLMLVLGACLVALTFAGCSSTGSCGGGQGLFNRGISAGCSGGCGESACSGGCGEAGLASKNYGGKTGLGLGLLEAGPSCKVAGCHDAGCNGECQAKKCPLRKLQLGSRLKQRHAGCESCGSGDCGCGAPALPESGSGYAVPTSAPTSACGCTASAPVSATAPVSVSDSGYAASASADGSAGCGCDVATGHEVVEEGSNVQLASHEDRGGLLGKLGFGRKHQARGCGVRGCGPASLCSGCLSRLRSGAGGGLGAGGGFGLGGGAGTIPHRDPSIHSGGASAGPAGQIPTYAYPYYTTRAPRDFLDPNPPTIGY